MPNAASLHSWEQCNKFWRTSWMARPAIIPGQPGRPCLGFGYLAVQSVPPCCPADSCSVCLLSRVTGKGPSHWKYPGSACLLFTWTTSGSLLLAEESLKSWRAHWLRSSPSSDCKDAQQHDCYPPTHAVKMLEIPIPPGNYDGIFNFQTLRLQVDAWLNSILSDFRQADWLARSRD